MPRARPEKAMPRITPERLEQGQRSFEKHEGRESMYRVAMVLLPQCWGRYADMTDALSVLLLTWNNAFYRFGLFDAAALEAVLKKHWATIDEFHGRDIMSLADADRPRVSALFRDLLKALRIRSGKSRGRRSPVAVAKALHLLAPNFFPLWDTEIAAAYGFSYHEDPSGTYLAFCDRIRDIAMALAPAIPPSPKSLLKRIDEFNYAKYTQGWV
jgi:hypothetical protein